MTDHKQKRQRQQKATNNLRIEPSTPYCSRPLAEELSYKRGQVQVRTSVLLVDALTIALNVVNEGLSRQCRQCLALLVNGCDRLKQGQKGMNGKKTERLQNRTEYLYCSYLVASH